MQNSVASFTPEQRLKMLREWIASHKREAVRLHRGNPKAKAAAEADADRMDAYAVSLLSEHRPGMPTQSERLADIERELHQHKEDEDHLITDEGGIFTDPRDLAEAIVAADPLTKWVRGK